MKKNTSYDSLVGQPVVDVLHAASAAVLPRVLDADQGSRILAELVEEYYEEYLRLNPLRASATGDHRFDDQFPNDISEEYRSKQEALCRQYLQRLAKFKPLLLSSRQDQLSYQCLKQRLESDLEGTTFEHYRLMPLNQFSSNAILFPIVGSGNSYHPFKTVRDYDNFLKRSVAFRPGLILPSPTCARVWWLALSCQNL